MTLGSPDHFLSPTPASFHWAGLRRVWVFTYGPGLLHTLGGGATSTGPLRGQPTRLARMQRDAWKERWQEASRGGMGAGGQEQR